MLEGIRKSRPERPARWRSVTSVATSAMARPCQRKSFSDALISWPARPKSTWMPGDWMSASMTPTRRPLAARHAARFAVVFDLPVPPRNECTETIDAKPASVSWSRGRIPALGARRGLQHGAAEQRQREGAAADDGLEVGPVVKAGGVAEATQDRVGSHRPRPTRIAGGGRCPASRLDLYGPHAHRADEVGRQLGRRQAGPVVLAARL